MENITYQVHENDYDFDEALQVYQEVLRVNGRVVNSWILVD